MYSSFALSIVSVSASNPLREEKVREGERR